MARFRKRPVVINAWKVADLLQVMSTDWQALPAIIRKSYGGAGGIVLIEPDRISINTLEGVMVAMRDDWIICDVRGELYPCKPDIFAATYDAA